MEVPDEEGGEELTEDALMELQERLAKENDGGQHGKKEWRSFKQVHPVSVGLFSFSLSFWLSFSLLFSLSLSSIKHNFLSQIAC